MDASQNADDSKPPTLPAWLRPWLLGGLVGFVAWGVVVGFAWHLLSLKHEWIGQWGDSFAPLTGIASTLALVMTTWAVSLQRRDLELQREELRLTREEMIAQREEMALQRAAQEKSAAEQAAANRIANLANAIAIKDGIQNCYSMTIAAQAAPVTLRDAAMGKDVHLPDPSTNTGAALRIAIETIQALKALESQLEGESSSVQHLNPSE